MNTAHFLRDFAEELYFRAACAQSKEERKAIKGVQHSLEKVMAKHGFATFDRQGEQNGKTEKNTEAGAPTLSGDVGIQG